MTAQFIARPDARKVTLTFPLRDYQGECEVKLTEAKRRGIIRPLVALPTGTGKTVIFADIIARMFGDSLVLVHRDELVRQTVEKLNQICPELSVGVIKAEQNDVNATAIVASVQTLSRPKRLAQIKHRKFRRIIVDEAHHATADSYRAVLEELGSFADEDPTFTMGFTATPERGDKTNLKHVWQEIVYSRGILDMIRQGYLVDLVGRRIKLKGFNLDHVKRVAGDWSDSALAEEMTKVEAPFHIAEGYHKFGEGRPALCFTPTVAFAYAVAEEMNKLGDRAEVVHANTPTENPNDPNDMTTRQGIYKALRTGRIKAVVNCGVLTEGFDEPCISCIMVARPCGSRPLYTQIVGRGTRLFPGKVDCLVLDYCGVSGRHELVTLGTLFELTEKELQDGVAVTEACEQKERRLAEWAASMESAEDELAGATTTATPVNLFSRKSINWIHTNDGGFIVSIPSGHMELTSPDGDTYSVVVKQRDVEPRVVAAGMNLEYAQGVAEDEIRKNGWIGLVKADAKWRQAMMTEPQAKALAKLLRRPLTQDEKTNLTKGQASDMMTKLIAEKPPKRNWW